MRTYNDIYLSARKTLRAQGIAAFNLEARLIVTAASEKTKEQFFRDIQLYATDDFEDKVNDMLRRRTEGEPIAYITGEWEFYGLPVVVSEDVLIPRIDTEVLVDHAIEILKGRESTTRVLDLCSGSGCIGMAIAANVPDSRVVLVDNSLKAMRLSRTNILRNNLTRSITCVDADATASPPMLLGRFDMIACNPPYIPTREIIGLDPSVRDYEPVWALDGGEDGLDYYRSISSKWKVILKKNGTLIYECGDGQAEHVKDILIQNGFDQIRIYKDSLDIERVVAGILR